MAVFRVTRVRDVRGCDVVEVCGDLDMSVTARLGAVLDCCLSAGSQAIEVDLAGVTLIDADAVSFLLRAARTCRERGTPLSVVRAGGTVLRVLEVTGAVRPLAAAPGASAPSAPPPAAGHGTPHDVAPGEADPEAEEPGEAARVAALADSVHQLLCTADALPPDDPRRHWLRERAVEQALPYARRLASRYRHRGEPVEDLCQVAAMGLVKAVNGYRPERTTGFLGYATPTILGELRRHFRDAGWTVRVPRRIQELRPEVNRAVQTLTQALGHRPGTGEVAALLDVPEADVAECVAASQNYSPISLSTPLGQRSQELGDAVGAEDPGLDLVECRQAVAPLLASLTPHEREVVTLRFYGEMTQSQIAARVGSSQMHVSRLLASVLNRLRDELAEGSPAPDPARATRSARQRPAQPRQARRPSLATRS